VGNVCVCVCQVHVLVRVVEEKKTKVGGDEGVGR